MGERKRYFKTPTMKANEAGPLGRKFLLFFLIAADELPLLGSAVLSYLYFLGFVRLF
jgi:hypothetical protein